MQLKSIEIIGFKSFADKTRIDFPGGMTGIVGPNGSGKSNIAESIRWVMGEQSAKNLRGSKMPDVIFSGSADRRSLGMASVTLTLDNSDRYINTPLDELQISRKLFRNGDSSYFINDKQCRLRDITDLFMDTGIGQGSLSIISQGNVEEIFNSKPIERRSVIENVAGVYKYKQHKQTAKKEIDETTDNLNRVEDIIHELQVRLQPLEEQSSLATDYLDQKKRLDTLLKQQLVLATTQLLSETQALKASSTAKQAIVTKLTKQVAEGNHQQNSLKQQVNDGRKQIDDLNDQLLETAKKIQFLKSQHQLTTQEKSFKNADLNRITEQIKLTQNQIDDYQIKLSQSADQQHQLKADLNANTTELTRITTSQQQNSVAAIETKIEALRNHYVDLLQEQTDIKNQVNDQVHDNQRTHEKIVAQQARIDQADNEVKTLQEQSETLKLKLADSHHELETNQQKLADLEKVLAKNKKIVDDHQANWLAALKIAEEAKAKATSLRQLHDSYRGFYRGVSNLLRHKDQLNGILGPVADYLKVDPKYVKAINTALGSQVQHVIVEDNRSAAAAIKYLTQGRLGRVTLLPISTISARSLNTGIVSAARQAQGYIGIASELVSMPDQLNQIKGFLLGTTLIADQLDHAIEMSQLIHHRTRIVTLDGQVVNAGGSLTGGANRGDDQGVLIQKTELEALTKSTAEMSQKLTEKETMLNHAKAELQKIIDSHERGRQHVFELKQIDENQNQQLNKLAGELAKKQREAETYKLALKNLSSSSETGTQPDLTAKSQSIQAELDQINHQLTQQKDRLDHVKELAEKYSKAKQAVHDQIVVAKQKIQQTERSQNEIHDQIKVHQATLQKLQGQREQHIAELAETVDAGRLNHEIKQAVELQADLNKQLATKKQQVADDDQQLDHLGQRVQSDQLNLNNAKHELQEVTTKLQKSIQTLQANYEQLQSNYDIDPKQLGKLKLDVTIEHMNNQIKMLRTGIDEIGPVNISAIQEFKEVSARYNFLIKQQQDLLDAKNHLTETMADMDSTISTKFATAFKEVARAFSKVFVDMFGGGEAKLVLTDPEDLLTTGIEIMVKPPGKNYRSLSLLSGGEKALTAITLLFAIIKVRPVPFCILDEAEAALDPFNADRFAKFLKRFGDQTQFVVITHRKETMIYADQLYGVTMQESGVSKVVTVNLDNLQTEVS